MSHIDLTIADLQKEIEEMEDEIIQSKRMINRLCAKAGREPIYPATDLKKQDTLTLRSDLFYGQPLATNIKLVMTMKRASGGGPVTVNEIYDTLLKGGYKFETDSEDNAKRGLRISLRKNMDFHKLPNGHYGLTEWYPKAKGDGSDRRSDSPKQPSVSAGNGTPDGDDDDDDDFIP